LLANVYLEKFDREIGGRGVPAIRYAEGIVVLAKRERTAERQLKFSRKYLEGKLKLRMNMEKSRVASVVAGFGILTHTIAKKGSYIFRII